MFITTRSKEVASIVERTEYIEQRKKSIKKALIPRPIVKLTAKQKEIFDNWADLKRVASVDSRDFDPQKYYTHQKLIDRYPNRTWFENRCFIIGGGPSLKDFDFSRLNNELTIAVNRAHEYVDPSIIFFTDQESFYMKLLKGEFGKEARNKFIVSRALKIALNIGGANFDHGTFSIPLSKYPDMTFDLKDGLFDGGNSGFAALNLAVCLGSKTIYLLGYDMRGDGQGNQAWFHGGYKKVGKERSYKSWIKYFEQAAPALERRGIKVINLNSNSEIRCFEFGKFEDLDPKPGYEYHEEFDAKKIMPHKHKDLYFAGALGFGDNFYQRPVVKELARTYRIIFLRTAFPEVYWDIPNIEFVYPEPLNLRTQKKYVENLPKKTWSNRPKEADFVQWSQVGPAPHKNLHTKYNELERRENFDFTFPVRNEWVKAAKKLIDSLPLDGKKLCIVRRPTNRKEWNCPARNPKIEYYQLLIDRYAAEYYFLGLADIKKDEEWFEGDLHGLDKEFNKGEIPLTTILGILKIADMTITYPSFFMIAAIAIRAKCFCIFGGIAGPEYLLRRNLGLSNFSYVAPVPFCNCHKMDHNCNKKIPIERILNAFNELKNRRKSIKIVSIGVPPGMGDSYWVMTKMESFKEKNAIDHLAVVVHRDSIHYYTADYLKLLPFVDEVRETKETLKIGRFYEDKENPGCIAENIQGIDYLIDPGAKMWLKGTHLKDILPEYKTNYQLSMNLSMASKEFATAIKDKNKGKLVLFYTSSKGNNCNWNKEDWKYEDWMNLANLIYENSGIRPMAIGAEWDRDYINELKKLDKNDSIQDFVGGIDIQLTLSMIKESNLVISFACGIPILATYFGIPTVIFWAINGISKSNRFNPSFQYSWIPPGMEKKNKYIPVAYGSKEATPEWIFNKIKEFL